MRIVHILAPAAAGGLERVVHALAIAQHRTGYQVLVAPVVEAWTGTEPFAEPLVRAGVDIQPVVVAARAYGRERAAISALLESVAPDALHSHGYHTDVVVSTLRRRGSTALVATSHGYTGGPWRNRVYESLDRLALRRFDAVAAVSQRLADELRGSGIRDDRVRVIPNAWSEIARPLDRGAARSSLGLESDALTVGWVGRMSREKGLDVMIDALASLADLPISACAIGDGPERATEQRHAAAAGIADRIHWPGLVREAGRYFRAFDALVISSRTEGVPIVLLEAIAAGVPIVATRVGGIPDIVSSDQALLVPPEKPDALAEAIRCVVTGPAAAAKRAALAKERVARDLGEKSWLEAYDALYRSRRP